MEHIERNKPDPLCRISLQSLQKLHYHCLQLTESLPLGEPCQEISFKQLCTLNIIVQSLHECLEQSGAPHTNKILEELAMLDRSLLTDLPGKSV